MPKVTMYFDQTRAFNGPDAVEAIRMLGSQTRRLVAVFASVPGENLLDPRDDIDFIPQPYPPGTQTAAPVAFEIETIGYPARKAKLKRAEIVRLKRMIVDYFLEIQGCPDLDPKQPLIWIKYVDPDGQHV